MVVSWPNICVVVQSDSYFYYFYHQEKHLLAHSNCYPHFTCFAVCKEAAWALPVQHRERKAGQEGAWPGK